MVLQHAQPQKKKRTAKQPEAQPAPGVYHPNHPPTFWSSKCQFGECNETPAIDVCHLFRKLLNRDHRNAFNPAFFRIPACHKISKYIALVRHHRIRQKTHCCINNHHHHHHHHHVPY